MRNPFNPAAGATPFPTDPLEVRVTEDAATLMWRACPYFAWRYGDRGRAFGRSDAGFLVTLVTLPTDVIDDQLHWLVRVLAPRGMPGVLVELQLQVLARVGRRAGWPTHAVLAAAGRRLRQQRAAVFADAALRGCEHSLRADARGLPHAFGTGFVIAGAVADERMGVGDHADALVDWLLAHGASEPRWAQACRRCCDRARAVGGARPARGKDARSS